jgi:hypothetical protein
MANGLISFHTSINLYSMRGLWFGHIILADRSNLTFGYFQGKSACLKLHKSMEMGSSLKAKDSLAIKKFTQFYATRWFITAL